MVLLCFFLPFSAFCQQEEAVITIQEGATVYGEFYIASNKDRAPSAKSPQQIDTKAKKRSAAHSRLAEKKTEVAKPAVKTPASPIKVRCSEERLAFLQNFSSGRCGVSASHHYANALQTKLLGVAPLFLSEKKQASALRSAEALSFVNDFKTRGPPETA